MPLFLFEVDTITILGCRYYGDSYFQDEKLRVGDRQLKNEC